MSIDWTQALVAGIVGGLIGALVTVGRFLYRKLRLRFGSLVAALLTAAGMAGAAAAVAFSPLGATGIDYLAKQRARSRIARAMTEPMKPLLESPAFQQRIEGLSRAEVQALASELSKGGLLRLSDDQLIRRAHLLREAIVAADEETCAANLYAPTPEQAQQLLTYLSEESLREWSKLAAEASLASLRNEPSRDAPSPSDAQEAIRRLLVVLPEADARRLAETLAKPAARDAVDACWTARTIYETFVDLPAEDKLLLARVLAAN